MTTHGDAGANVTTNQIFAEVREVHDLVLVLVAADLPARVRSLEHKWWAMPAGIGVGLLGLAAALIHGG